MRQHAMHESGTVPDATEQDRPCVDTPAKAAGEAALATPAEDHEGRPSVGAEGSSSRPGRWRLAYLLLGVVAAGLAFLFSRVTLDDAFITWRYGWNLVEHGVWGWNPSGRPVEAYTNPLYAALSIVPALFGWSPELFFKIVSLAVLAGFVFGVRRARLPRGQEFALFAVALASPIFFLQLFSGLETVSFALTIAWTFALVYRRGGLGRSGLAAALLLALSRPEGIVFAGVALGWSMLLDRSAANRRRALVVVVAWAGYWIARWWYFGEFFPNTFAKKTEAGRALLLRAVEVLPVAGPLLLPVVLGAVFGVTIYFRNRKNRLPSSAVAVQAFTPAALALTAAAVALAGYGPSNLVMNTGDRFFWQVFFPVVVVVLAVPLPADPFRREPGGAARAGALTALVIAVAALLCWPGSHLSVASGVGLAMIVVAVVLGTLRAVAGSVLLGAVGLACAIGFGNATELVSTLAYRHRLAAAHQAIGSVLADQPRVPGSVAVGDAGVLPYLADVPVVDIGGLASAEAAAGTLSSADLERADLQFALLQSSSDDARSVWPVDAAPAVRDYVSDPGKQFWSAPAVEFAPGYYLNYWAGPKLHDEQFGARLGQAFLRSRAANDRPDTEIVGQHLWDLPFLSSPTPARR